MIAVYMPALILEVFTAYSAIKDLTTGIPVSWLTWIEFLLCNIFLVLPSFIAIYVSASSTNLCQSLKKHIETSSNYFQDDVTFKVVIWISIYEFRKEQMKIMIFFFFQFKALARKLQNRQIIFTTEFFDINWTLALSIFGTIATYMVIICQFEKDL